MFCSMLSGIVSGAAGCIIQVEAELRSGLPYFTMVGRLSNEAKESRHRVESALRALGCPLPPMKVTVNLSPADIRKTGTAFDLPIAAAVMAGLNYIPFTKEPPICLLGELGTGRQCPWDQTVPAHHHGRKKAGASGGLWFPMMIWNLLYI